MRRYSLEEASEILNLAGKLPDNRDGFTLEEILAAGSELGYAPAQLASAALEVDRRRAAEVDARNWVFESRVPGSGPLPNSAWESVVAEVRAQFNVPGVLRERSDGGREWTGVADSDSVVVAAVPCDSGFELLIRVDRRNVRVGVLVVSITVLIFLCVATAGSLAKSGVGSIQAMGGLLALLFAALLSVGTLRQVARSGRRKLGSLVGRLSAIATASSAAREDYATVTEEPENVMLDA